jgi:hypothetical protein
MSSDIRVINRAAWALGNLDAVETVPRLVSALISTESQIVLVPVDGNMGGLGPGSPGVPALAPIATNKQGTAWAFLSPPVVNQGVIAYGATVVPTYELTPGLAAAGGLNYGTQINRMPEPKVVTYTYQNVEVLSALKKLTGQDFDFDVEAWQHWVARSFNPNPKPARKVPQP